MQKGFADIPLGEASPFIMRRTTVRRCSPRIAARQTGTVTTASTSAPDKVLEPISLQSPSVDMMANGSNRKSLSQSGEEKTVRRLSLRNTPEQKEQVLIQQAQQGDNCHVQ